MSKFDILYAFLVCSVVVSVISFHFIRQERMAAIPEKILEMEQQNQKNVDEILESMRKIQNTLSEMQEKK